MQPWSALCALLIRVAGLMDVPGVRQETASLAIRVAGTLVPLLKQQQGEHTPHRQCASLIAVAGALVVAMLLCR